MTFQTPVATSTANAGHATWLNRRAAARGTSAPAARSVGTSAARTSWPPTHTVAARTCSERRTASHAGVNTLPTLAAAVVADRARDHLPISAPSEGTEKLP